MLLFVLGAGPAGSVGSEEEEVGSPGDGCVVCRLAISDEGVHGVGVSLLNLALVVDAASSSAAKSPLGSVSVGFDID